eukprot:jgi/Ulvmu1/11081/UM007_0263.1
MPPPPGSTDEADTLQSVLSHVFRLTPSMESHRSYAWLQGRLVVAQNTGISVPLLSEVGTFSGSVPDTLYEPQILGFAPKPLPCICILLLRTPCGSSVRRQ